MYFLDWKSLIGCCVKPRN